jgi:hypothetical protein
MNIRFKPLGVWPRAETIDRQPSRFKSNYNGTLRLLEKELDHLGAEDAELQLDMKLSDIAIHGWPKANARATSPRIILSFTAYALEDAPVRVFPCDAFTYWEDNLRAIALTLHDLRRIDRYGTALAGEQYAGFKQIGATSTVTMSAVDAAMSLQEVTRLPATIILSDASVAKEAVRAAIARTHPDRNAGDRKAYDAVDQARSILSSHHGVSL